MGRAQQNLALLKGRCWAWNGYMASLKKKSAGYFVK